MGVDPLLGLLKRAPAEHFDERGKLDNWTTPASVRRCYWLADPVFQKGSIARAGFDARTPL
jgi:hypothetical protein